MNREILFRGKRIDNGEWVEGQYAFLLNFRTKDGEPITHMIVDGTPFGQAVDPSSVGQWTGLTDKNGVKIFEGDIIFDQRPSIQKTYIVIWFGSSFCRRTKDGHYLSPLILNCNEFEIIGNIHDSPELTEGE